MVAILLSGLLVVAVIGIVSLLSVLSPAAPRVNKIPPTAVSIGPDNYMRVWATDTRVCFVFRNIPRATICFDRRAAHDFGVWLQSLDKTTE